MEPTYLFWDEGKYVMCEKDSDDGLLELESGGGLLKDSLTS